MPTIQCQPHSPAGAVMTAFMDHSNWSNHMMDFLRSRAILFSLGILLLYVLPCSAQSLPSLGGAWTSGGKSASITQDPSDPNRLVFTNEYGSKSSGSFANSTTVIAHDWENGLRGTLTDNGRTIRWANGTAWLRAGSSTDSSSTSSGSSINLPSLGGAWTSGGKSTSITQDPSDSNRLVFTNEYGSKSSGSFANSMTVIAHDWENGLRGTLTDNGQTIRWANGTAWLRAGSSATTTSASTHTPTLHDLGTTLVVIHPSVCAAIWTRTQPGVYDSVTICQGPGNASFRETLTVRSNDGQTVVIDRPGYGQFRGSISSDGRTIRGTCNWSGCGSNYHWTAYVDWNWNDSPPLRN